MLEPDQVKALRLDAEQRGEMRQVVEYIDELERFRAEVISGCDIDKGEQGVFRQVRVVKGPGKTQDQIDVENLRTSLEQASSQRDAAMAGLNEARDAVEKAKQVATRMGNNALRWMMAMMHGLDVERVEIDQATFAMVVDSLELRKTQPPGEGKIVFELLKKG